MGHTRAVYTMEAYDGETQGGKPKDVVCDFSEGPRLVPPADAVGAPVRASDGEDARLLPHGGGAGARQEDERKHPVARRGARPAYQVSTNSSHCSAGRALNIGMLNGACTRCKDVANLN